MKKKIIVMAFFCSVLCAELADASALGKEISFKRENGIATFDVLQMRTPKPFWLLLGTFNARDLLGTGPLQKISWRLFDADAQKFVSEWQTEFDGPPIYYDYDYGVNWCPEVVPNEALVKLRSIQLVIAVNSNEPTHFVDLGSFCKLQPRSFRDDSMNFGCPTK